LLLFILYIESDCAEGDFWNIGENVFEQWLKRWLFTPSENDCSCAVESEAD